MILMSLLMIGLVSAKELDPELAAESKRIREEMMSLAQQESWSGVERHYQQIMSLEKAGVVIEANDHMLAASAAAFRGELDELINRLEAAVATGHAEKAQVWLDTLIAQTATIEIKLQVSGAVTLKPSAFIVDQSHSAALRKAEQILLRTGEFSGRLPVGTFTIVNDSYTYSFTVQVGENPKVLIDSSVLKSKQGPFRFGALYIGSYNQYLRNAVIEVAPRSHTSFGGTLGYSFTQINDTIAYGASLGFAGASGVGASHVLGVTNVWMGTKVGSGAIGLGPQLATGWSRVTGITEEHATLLCDPALCSDFNRLMDETVSQTRYVNGGFQLSYQHLPSEGVSWTVYAGSRFEKRMMVPNLGFNLHLGRVP